MVFQSNGQPNTLTIWTSANGQVSLLPFRFQTQIAYPNIQLCFTNFYQNHNLRLSSKMYNFNVQTGKNICWNEADSWKFSYKNDSAKMHTCKMPTQISVFSILNQPRWSKNRTMKQPRNASNQLEIATFGLYNKRQAWNSLRLQSISRCKSPKPSGYTDQISYEK